MLGPAAGDDGELVVGGRVPVDRARRSCRASGPDGPGRARVALVDGALLERPLQRRVRPLALGHRHDAGRAGVEAVHDALPLGRAARRRAGSPSRPGPAMTVGPVQPGLGCAATPTGLSTTTTSSSSCSTTRPSTGSRRGGSACGSGMRDLEQRPAVHLGAARRLRRRRRVTLAGVDELGGGGTREARAAARSRRPGAARPARPAPAAAGSQARVSASRPVEPSRSTPSTLSSAARIAPHTMAESARLKIGQCSPSGPNRLIQSTTWPRPHARRAEQPVAEVAERAAQHEAERDRPASAAHPARGTDDHRDDRERDQR